MKNTRQIVVALVIFLYTPTSSGADRCTEIAGKLVRKSASVTLSILKHSGKTLLYPAIGAPKLALATTQGIKENSWKTFFSGIGRILKSDFPHILGYAAMYGVQQRTGMTVSQYEALTGTLDRTEDDKDGVIVIIDGFPADDIYGGAGRYVFGSKFKDDPKAVLIEGKSFSYIEEQLNRIAKEKGPIKRVELFTHGFPRHILLTENGYHAPAWHDLGDSQIHADTFAPNAAVRFHSCFVGNGKNGAHMGRHLAQHWLRRGGKVILSKVQMVPNAVEMFSMKANLPEPPSFARRAGDALSVANGLWTAPILFGQVKPEEQFFAMPSDKVRTFHAPNDGKERDDLTGLLRSMSGDHNEEFAWTKGVKNVIAPGDMLHQNFEDPKIDYGWSGYLDSKVIPYLHLEFKSPTLAEKAGQELKLANLFTAQYDGNRLTLTGTAPRKKLESLLYRNRVDEVSKYLKHWRARVESENIPASEKAEKLRDVAVAEDHFRSFLPYFDPHPDQDSRYFR